MDCMTKEQRSANMRAIKSKDTIAEVIFRKALWAKGIRYRKNLKIGNCRPDIIITSKKIAIFVDGDFWHGNVSKYSVHTNAEYWNEKIKRNKERDLENTIELRDMHWQVVRVWESEIKTDLAGCVNKILNTIKKHPED